MKISNNYPSILYLLSITDKTLQINIYEEKVCYIVKKVMSTFARDFFD